MVTIDGTCIEMVSWLLIGKLGDYNLFPKTVRKVPEGLWEGHKHSLGKVAQDGSAGTVLSVGVLHISHQHPCLRVLHFAWEGVELPDFVFLVVSLHRPMESMVKAASRWWWLPLWSTGHQHDCCSQWWQMPWICLQAGTSLFVSGRDL